MDTVKSVLAAFSGLRFQDLVDIFILYVAVYYLIVFFKETRTMQMLKGLAVLLAMFTVEKRRREFGIRKVLGASLFSIFSLISNEFVPLLLIASGITLPLSYFFLKKYLSNWAYPVHPGIWIFVLTFIIVLLVAAVAICYQIITAINENPAKSIKYE